MNALGKNWVHRFRKQQSGTATNDTSSERHLQYWHSLCTTKITCLHNFPIATQKECKIRRSQKKKQHQSWSRKPYIYYYFKKIALYKPNLRISFLFVFLRIQKCRRCCVFLSNQFQNECRLRHRSCSQYIDLLLDTPLHTSVDIELYYW